MGSGVFPPLFPVYDFSREMRPLHFVTTLPAQATSDFAVETAPTRAGVSNQTGGG